MVRTGWYFAALPAALAGLLVWQQWWAAAGALASLTLFILFFFRDPERAIPAEPGAIVSPADGRVLSVEASEWEGEPRTRISIFLSIFNVHVNRAPIAGKITNLSYQPGRFHVASKEVAGERNEQNVITMEGEGTRVVFKQIAGLIARRIEFWRKTGDDLARGERVGMIRFGSRTEILFDPAYTVRVKPGDTAAPGNLPAAGHADRGEPAVRLLCDSLGGHRDP
jgi:phosphatidylserine decarboxylase